MFEVVTLSSVCNIVKQTPQQFDGYKQYVATANLQNSDIVSSTEVTFENRPSRADCTVNAGDVLFAKMAGTKKTLIAKRKHQEMLFSTGFAALRPMSEIIDSNYLYHILQSEEFLLEKDRMSTGATQKAITNRALLEIKISLPPLAEQKRIAAILDKADEIEQATTSAHSMKEQLIRSTFLDLFGDPHINPNKFQEMTLRDVSTHYTDGPFGSNLKSSHYTVEGPRVIRLGDIDIGEINDDNISHISAEHYQSLQRHHLREGDVVVATLGNPMLRSAIVARSALPAINKSDVVLIRPNTDLVLAEYISCLFNSTLDGGYWSNLVHGQTRGRISGGQLSKVVIPVPPLELQQIFVARMKLIAQFVMGLELAKSTSSSFVRSITHEMLS